ncbi:MAG: M20/M25/M40 family metallo-hydrolase [Planctomycetota bacterium]
MDESLPEDVVSLLQAMIRVNSVTPHASGTPDAERELADKMAALAVAWGLEANPLSVDGAAPNVLVTTHVDEQAPWLLLDSHLDTVDVGGMTVDPFGGELRDGRVYGRGACDTKGTGAAMLWALREAMAAGSAAANVAILFSVGEEHWQLGARWFVEQQLTRLGWRPAGVVVGEPTEVHAVAASNGFLRCRLTTRGRAAHSSTPDRGRNAVSDMARVIAAIEERHIAGITASHPLTGRGTCSINGITGGTQHNIIPESCEIQIDQRLAPGEVASDALASIHAAVAPVAEERPGLDYEIHTVETAPPFASEASLAWGDRVAEKLRAAGFASTVRGAPYTTNANHYAAADLPCVVLGPGDIAQAHTADEWIAVDALQEGVRAYRALIDDPPFAVQDAEAGA